MKELIEIQWELKAPKGKTNTFGNYKYRSCEDILEAVKPICKAHNCLLTLSDEIVQMGDRYYIKATAVLANKDGNISVSAYARESETKKGMDDSQITGTASSYARKYALNGLFCIDDTKDADTDEYKAVQEAEKYTEHNDDPVTKEQEKKLVAILDQGHKSVTGFCNYLGIGQISDLTQWEWSRAIVGDLDAVKKKRSRKHG